MLPLACTSAALACGGGVSEDSCTLVGFLLMHPDDLATFLTRRPLVLLLLSTAVEPAWSAAALLTAVRACPLRLLQEIPTAATPTLGRRRHHLMLRRTADT